jgi:phosphoribosylaminoimidazole-succinocarboxamide synthase
VRDTYRLNDRELLMVATDRLSAFDVVFPTPIPEKGRVLTQLSHAWFGETADLIRNHRAGDQSIPAELIARQPMGRLGNAEEVAQAALYLASDDAAFVTGTALVIDGGLMAR